jgi:hypothetical protein
MKKSKTYIKIVWHIVYIYIIKLYKLHFAFIDWFDSTQPHKKPQYIKAKGRETVIHKQCGTNPHISYRLHLTFIDWFDSTQSHRKPQFIKAKGRETLIHSTQPQD